MGVDHADEQFRLLDLPGGDVDDRLPVQEQAVVDHGGVDALGPREPIPQLLLVALAFGDVVGDPAHRVDLVILVAERELDSLIDTVLAVTPDDFLPLDQASRPQDALVTLPLRRGHAGRQEVRVPATEDPSGFKIEPLLEGSIDQLVARVPPLQRDRVGTVVEDRAQAALARAQRLIDNTTLGDVLQQAHGVGGKAIVIRDDDDPRQDPHDRPIPGDVALLPLALVRLAGPGTTQPSGVRFHVVRMGEVQEAPPDQLFPVIPEHPAQRVVDPQPSSVRRDDRHPGRSTIECRRHQPLRIASHDLLGAHEGSEPAQLRDVMRERERAHGHLADVQRGHAD